MKKEIKSVAVMGSSQINHIIPLLSQKYTVFNLQEILDKKENVVIKAYKFYKKLKQADILYNVFTSPYFYKKARIANIARKPVVTHWIGSDARYAAEGKTDLGMLKGVQIHVSCFKPLQEQLQHLGIETEIVPIVPFNLKFDINKMPKSHAVLIYMPKGVESDYGYEYICKVFPKYPELSFYIVANDDKAKFNAYPNVKVLGRLTLDEMEKLYDEVSIIIRMHVNDGLSMSVLEALAKGKKVIWDYDFPYCLPGKNDEQICNSLNGLLSEPPHPDYEAHEFILNNYSKEQVLSIYDSVFSKIM